MKLYAKGLDISNIVQDINWTGDTKAVARSITVNYYQNAKDKQLKSVSLTAGDTITMKDDKGKILFAGVIMTTEKKTASSIMTVTAYDLMFYVNKSDISKVFKGFPEQIVKSICNELDIKYGTIASTNQKVYYPCLGKPAYEAIMIAYSLAAKVNKKVYIPLIKDNKVCVIEKGNHCGVVIDGYYNLIDSSYKVTAENVVNRVQITDKTGKKKKVIEDTASRKKYGTIQKIYKQEDGKKADTEARAVLYGIEKDGNITALGDVRALAGYSITVQDKESGLYGLFFIESDSHTFSNGKHEMTLTLAFKNIMDTKEAEKDDKK